MPPHACSYIIYDNGDNNLSTSTVFDFHVDNVESNCEQFEEFENEANSDKEGKLTTSESHSKVCNKTIQLMLATI